jgi:hypothetical protein
MIARGRIIRATTGSSPPTPRIDAGLAGRRIAHAELEARERAAHIVKDAEDKARAIAAAATARAAEDARAAEHASLAALYLTLRAAEEKRAERSVR